MTTPSTPAPKFPQYTDAQIKRAHQIADQRDWIEEHGDNLAGYVLRYGSARDAVHYGNGGEAIYAADKAALDALLSDEVRVTRTYNVYHLSREAFREVAGDRLRGDALAAYARDLSHYEFAGTIRAASLDEAYRLTQNEFGTTPNGWHAEGRRSTSVGDFFTVVTDEAIEWHLVDTFGFAELARVPVVTEADGRVRVA